jgi:CRISPR-associated protein Cas1
MQKSSNISNLAQAGDNKIAPLSIKILATLTAASITQAAMRMLAQAGVLVGFSGSGGTPLLMATQIEWFTPQSEYRPTEYVQAWMGFWFDENKRLNFAKTIQTKRIDFLNKIWGKDKDLQIRSTKTN